jgi:hypothetical protein
MGGSTPAAEWGELFDGNGPGDKACSSVPAEDFRLVAFLQLSVYRSCGSAVQRKGFSSALLNPAPQAGFLWAIIRSGPCHLNETLEEFWRFVYKCY